MSMSLKQRIAIRLFAVLAIFSIVHAIVFYVAILHSFKKVEQQLTRQNVSRLQAAIRREGEYLGIFLKDWAQWDECYRFVVDLNDGFRQANLLDETLRQNRLRIVNFYNNEGRRVYSASQDEHARGEAVAGELAWGALPETHTLLNPDPDQNTVSGILLADEGPLLVAASRILTSSAQGPARGVLVMAKPVDDHLMAALSERLSLDVKLWSLHNRKVPASERAYLEKVPTPDAPVIVPVDGRTQRAYCTLTDFRGRPALLACIEAPRDVYGMARTAQWLGSLSIALAGVCVLIGIFALMQKTVILPVSRLTREVLRVRQQGNASAFRPSVRKDEIGILAREFSATLHELDQARGDAVQANQAKSALLATISHEMRTPLNGIIGLSEVILSQTREERNDDNIKLIITESERLLGLINELLENARIESGKLTIDRQPFDLRQILRDTGALLQGRVRQKGLELHVEVDPAIPSVLIGDSRRIHQIVVNLAGNAIKFTDRGSITIAARKLMPTDGDLTVEIAVTDTGPGIPPEHQRAIFTRFADAGGARGRESTGLGTFISKELVTRMGGTIGFESQPGTGTRFWFQLPLPRGDATATVHRAATPAPAVAGSPARILLVEDDLTSMQVMLHHLVNAGHHVSAARCGREAEAQASAAAFDLILMDVELPDVDGIEVTTRLRGSGGPNQQTPIIAMTAHASGHSHARCHDAGMSQILTKPVRRDTLLAAIGPWLANRTAPDREGVHDTPLDWSRALLEFANDTAALKTVTADFIAETSGRIVQMQKALTKADEETLRRQAHAIKGGAANLCAVPISLAAADMEAAVRRNDPAGCATALDTLETRLTALRSFIDQLHK